MTEEALKGSVGPVTASLLLERVEGFEGSVSGTRRFPPVVDIVTVSKRCRVGGVAGCTAIRKIVSPPRVGNSEILLARKPVARL